MEKISLFGVIPIATWPKPHEGSIIRVQPPIPVSHWVGPVEMVQSLTNVKLPDCWEFQRYKLKTLTDERLEIWCLQNWMPELIADIINSSVDLLQAENALLRDKLSKANALLEEIEELPVGVKGIKVSLSAHATVCCQNCLAMQQIAARRDSDAT